MNTPERPHPLRVVRALLDAEAGERPSEHQPREALAAVVTSAERGAWERCHRELDFRAQLYAGASDAVWYRLTGLARVAIDLARYGERREFGQTWEQFEVWAVRVLRALGEDEPEARARARILCGAPPG